MFDDDPRSADRHGSRLPDCLETTGDSVWFATSYCGRHLHKVQPGTQNAISCGPWLPLLRTPNSQLDFSCLALKHRDMRSSTGKRLQ